ncbi:MULTISPECIES: AAA family ATPase [unclassified Rhodococcus (in: high G+C Gram-positive bacteria)]|uniref:AAA family ATPase n=1 Tax=unclassified Rhodococcus (in: high G+C Gram-positive bacteria) TaxID=192944 RepID=UPI0027DF542E|nr:MULTISPECIES: AAA family ATPase [unclassified Rhodococcus (in: high G+C Gram-positive bacteria)]
MSDQIVDRPLMDVVMDAIDADAELNDAAKYFVMAALESESALAELLQGTCAPPSRPEPGVDVAEPVGAFLTSISVAGFRGIGPKAVLDLHPAPGITIVSGRNGSGKSSFAEALEYAITGTSYRWKKKASLWKDAWRNLHQSLPCEVRVGLTIEGSEPTVVGVDWAADVGLDDCATWTQVGNAKRRSGIDDLGWASAIELHRPMLSYDEIGGLIEDSPSALYDALDKLLGLEEISDAERRLFSVVKSAKAPRQAATAELRGLKTVVAEIDDDRARTASSLLRKRAADLDAVLAVATGGDLSVSSSLGSLRAIASLTFPTQDSVDTAETALRDAVSGTVDLADEALSVVEQRNDVLSAALQLHAEAGDGPCPVCSTGTLNDAWAEHSRSVLTAENDKLAEYKLKRRRLNDARQLAKSLISELADVQTFDGIDLAGLPAYRDAVAAAAAAPNGSAELADHVGLTFPDVIVAAEAVRASAAAELAAREDRWAPVAGRLAAWVGLERAARDSDEDVENLESAKKWITAHGGELRNQRLEPIAEQARQIWSRLRQESNVDIGSISLHGTNTRRKAVLTGTVDGVESQAMSVMSQGELHALALALFIPRATTPNSPFRFVVLDDPIQAMDPAKIDGFVNVLSMLARTRQVVVFSHDDRLASAIRQLAVDARLVEVTREAGSTISTAETLNQALRYVQDVDALVRDVNVPDAVKRRAAPGLFRLALEAAAQQTFYAKQYRSGAGRTVTEEQWNTATSTRKRLALAVHGDPSSDITGWLGYRKERHPTMRLANAGAHGADVSVDTSDVNDLRRMVEGMLNA